MNTQLSCFHQCLWTSWAVLMCSLPCFSQQINVPNASFEDGKNEPLAWELSGGSGEWSSESHTGSRSLSVSGSGVEGDSNYWFCQNVNFEPNQTYRISFFTKVRPGTTGGTIMTGSSLANRDYGAGTEWTKKSFIFTTPDDTTGAYLRFGQWQKSGTIWFDDIELVKVQPIHHQIDELELGDGEQLKNGVYIARLNFGGEASNSSRVLRSHTAGFNSSRWTMGENAEVVYCHQIGKYSQKSASVTVQIGYYRAGECVVEASVDGENWTELGRMSSVNTETFDLPKDWFPLEVGWIRLRSAGEKSNFQIHSYRYTAELDDAPADTIRSPDKLATCPTFVGKTDYVEILTQSDELPVEILSLGDLCPGGDNQIQLRLNHTEPMELNIQVSNLSYITLKNEVQSTGNRNYRHQWKRSGAYDPGDVVELENDLSHAGDCEIELIIAHEDETLYHARSSFTVSHLYESDFGYFLAADPTAELWWCEGTHKVSRDRPGVPQSKSKPISISAAKNEYEPFQLVIRPKNDFSGVTAKISDFASASGAQISAENIDLSLVEYVHVEIPTDPTGASGDWPDPLPPLDGSFDLSANKNQPLWITVYVPEDAFAGDYEGKILLANDDWRQSIPINLHVWDFALPEETHVRSAFGFSSGDVKRYHHLETNDELQTVIEKYHQNFSEHRISPYYPLAPIHVNFGDADWIGGQRDNSTSFDGKQSLKVVDDNTTGNTTAHTGRLIPIEKLLTSYELSWAIKTEKPGQEYLVTFNCYDAEKSWMSGCNIDLLNVGSGEWEKQLVLLGAISSNSEHNFPDKARFVRLALRPVPWTESGENTGTAWFDAIEFRQHPNGENLIPDPNFERTFEDIEVTVDFTEFDQTAEKAFGEYKFNTFRLPLHGLGGGTFHSRHFGSIAGYKQGTPEHEALFTKYVRKLQDHLEEKGWLDEAFVYWFDEPTPRDYDFVRDGMELIHRAGPKLTRMLTEEPTEPLYGSVEIWCPVTPNYNFEIAEDRRKAGENFWWYVCTGPKAPYCTLFIDHHAVELRMWLWQSWKYKVEGILVWRSNYWTSSLAFASPKLQNPYADPMSYQSGYGRPVGYIGYWGNGDGRFIYPPKSAMESDEKCFDGPVNSIRWEMLREGIEDYEYFWLLRNLIDRAKVRGEKFDELAKRSPDKLATCPTLAEELLQIPDSITKSMTEFSVDPKPLYEHRRKIARAIEQLLFPSLNRNCSTFCSPYRISEQNKDGNMEAKD